MPGLAQRWASLLYWSHTQDPAAAPPEVSAAQRMASRQQQRSSAATYAGMGMQDFTTGQGPESDFWYEPLVPPGGFPMTEDIAMSIGAVFSCVRLLSETIGSLPLPIFKKQAGGEKARADDHPTNALLNTPNLFQDGWNWRTQQVAWLALRGVAYNRLLMKQSQLAYGEIRPLMPDAVVTVQNPDGSITYRWHRPTGQGSGYVDLGSNEMLVLRGLSLDGVTPCSLIRYARDSFQLAKSMAQHGTSVFMNNAQPSGVLTYEGMLEPTAKDELRRQWAKTHGGPQNAGKVAVLEDGMKWQQIGLTSADAEFLASRKFQVNEIARWFRVPPHMVGDLERATFANIEHQGIEFVTLSLRPWLVMIERAINAALLPEDGSYFAEHVIEGLLRGDSIARVAVYTSGLNSGWMTPNEVRRLENLPRDPDPQSDKLRSPLNMTPAAKPEGDQQQPPGRQGDRPPPPPPPNPGKAAAARLLAKETKMLGRLHKESTNGGFALQVEAFYAAHQSFVRQVTECDEAIAERYCSEHMAKALRAKEEGLLPHLLHSWETTRWTPAMAQLLHDMKGDEA